MRSVVLRIGIIGAIVIGAIILRPFIMGNAGSLQVGDCFDPPTVAGETVDDVQHHPCTESHGAEVVFVGNYSPVTNTYPGDAEFSAFFQNTCTTAFNTYTGIDFATDTLYDMAAFTPTSDGWAKNDRKVICYAVRLDDAKMTQSIRKT